MLMVAGLLALGAVSINAAAAGEAGGDDLPRVDIDRAVIVESPIEPTADALEAIVAVSATRCGDIMGGTGFFVGEGLVVTAAHLVEPKARIAMIGSGTPATSGPARLGVPSDLAVASHEVSDAVSLRLAKNDPKPGTPVVLIGVERGGRVAAHSGEITASGAARDYGLSGGDLLVADIAVEPGHSGGPVLDANGFVVGVIAAGESRTSTTLITPVSELRSMIGEVGSAEIGFDAC
jgi:S1-C subfamily serine protease